MKLLLKYLRPAAWFFDLVLSPLTLVAVAWFRIVRYWGVRRMPVSQKLFLHMGMIPVVDHYYEPLIDYRKLPATTPTTRIDLGADKQKKFIQNFSFQDALADIPVRVAENGKFHYNNGSFGSGDAELYYSIIRQYRPARIIEVGSGFSTLIAVEAINDARQVSPGYDCELTCIEPYEMPFLESTPVRLLRKRVEEVDQSLFGTLMEGDILFIDSSHMIRPGGDVNFLILHVLPALNRGVYVHFHDIFLPDHYPVEWLKDEFRLWNEQYLLEAFLSDNNNFEVVFAMAYMNSHHREEIIDKFPVLGTEPDRRPGSIWLRKTL